MDGVIYAAICRNISEVAAADKSDPFNVSKIEVWKKATFLFNIKDDQQVIGLEAANGVGKPDSVIAGLTQTLNALKNGIPYRISVSSLPEAGSFQKAISMHPGRITSITFDLVTPNPPKVDDAIRKGLKELREETGASRRKETIESNDGLHTDAEYIQERAKYTEAGGGSAVAKSGRETVYNSDKKTRSINVPNELRPETKKSKADYIRSVISRLIK